MLSCTRFRLLIIPHFTSTDFPIVSIIIRSRFDLVALCLLRFIYFSYIQNCSLVFCFYIGCFVDDFFPSYLPHSLLHCFSFDYHPLVIPRA